MAHSASRGRAIVSSFVAASAFASAIVFLGACAVGCSSSDPQSVPRDAGLIPLGGGDAGPLVFGTTAAVTGAQDTHCGSTVQATSATSCHPAGGGGGGGVTPGGGYGATMFNSSGSDDNCKYDVTWASTVIVENKNAYLQVTAKNRTDQSPLKGAAPFVEIFREVDDNPGPSLNGTQTATETAPGTYVIGPVQLDEPTDGGTAKTQGYWTARFHFNETCSDVQPDSPHGHAAFYLQVP